VKKAKEKRKDEICQKSITKKGRGDETFDLCQKLSANLSINILKDQKILLLNKDG